jgi:hypothetical protein
VRKFAIKKEENFKEKERKGNRKITGYLQAHEKVTAKELHNVLKVS